MAHREIGTGHLSWRPAERRTDRYGTVGLYEQANAAEPRPLPAAHALDGARGTLRATVLKPHRSSHIGDLFRGFHPPNPPLPVGTERILGTGTLFIEEGAWVGVRPDDGRDHDWLEGQALYDLHSSDVRLVFVEEDQAG